MAPDSIAREEGMFGNVFVEHYGGTREHEVKVWNEAVTSWEGTFKLCSGPQIFADTLCSSGTISRAGIEIMYIQDMAANESLIYFASSPFLSHESKCGTSCRISGQRERAI